MTLPKAIKDKQARVKQLEKELAEFELTQAPKDLISRARRQLELERCQAILSQEREELAIAIAEHEAELEKRRKEREDKERADRLRELADNYNGAINEANHWLEQFLEFADANDISITGRHWIEPNDYLVGDGTYYRIKWSEQRQAEHIAWCKANPDYFRPKPTEEATVKAEPQRDFGIIQLTHVGAGYGGSAL